MAAMTEFKPPHEIINVHGGEATAVTVELY